MPLQIKSFIFMWQVRRRKDQLPPRRKGNFFNTERSVKKVQIGPPHKRTTHCTTGLLCWAYLIFQHCFRLCCHIYSNSYVDFFILVVTYMQRQLQVKHTACICCKKLLLCHKGSVLHCWPDRARCPSWCLQPLNQWPYPCHGNVLTTALYRHICCTKQKKSWWTRSCTTTSTVFFRHWLFPSQFKAWPRG